MDKLIVSRHNGLVEWLAKNGVSGEVVSHISNAEEVRGKIVVGNLPLHLAAEAQEVWSVEMDLPAEMRGKELTVEDMDKYGGRIRKYKVVSLD